MVAIAQNPIEKFPSFKECEDFSVNELEDCFYTNLYAALHKNYEHPQGLPLEKGEKVTLRFEVDREGKFIPIRFDAVYAELTEAIKKSFNKLPVVNAPTYNGNPTYMQFVLIAPVPMTPEGSFQVYNGKDQESTTAAQGLSPLDSIAFAKTNKEYTQIISNKYDGQQLKSNGLIALSNQRYHRYEAAMNKVGNNAHTAVKPYSFSYVNQYFDIEAERESLIKEETTWLGKKWWNEHFFEVAGEDYWFVIDPGVDLQLGKDTGEDINTFNNTRLVNISGGIGKQITFGASIQIGK